MLLLPRSPVASPVHTRVSSPIPRSAALHLHPSLLSAATSYCLPKTPLLPARQFSTARRSCTPLPSLLMSSLPGRRPCAKRTASLLRITGHNSNLSCCAASGGGWVSLR